MKGNLLIVDDEPNILKTLEISLRGAGYEVFGFANAEDALREIDKDLFGSRKYAAALIDLMMFPMNGITLMAELHRRMPDLTVVIITAHGTVETAVEALKRGAYDYLQKPFDYKELLAFVDRVVQSDALKRNAPQEQTILTNNSAFQQILKTTERIANSNLAILIEGETGTGKELLADFIHAKSDRAKKPIVKLNCAALSAELIESELFGHVKGSFTGAVKDREGRVEAANGGTLFLDEVGEMPIQMQAKLLRFLQNKEYQRIGENETRTSDVRIVAATNRNLEEAIAEKNFREDLFYRLSGFRILMPPLRLRKEDIIPLAELFVSKASTAKIPSKLSKETQDVLLAYDWRGNVRELENAMLRAAILSGSDAEIKPDALPEHITKKAKDMTEQIISNDLSSLEEVERLHIEYILSKTSSLEEAAQILQIDSATLWRKRKKYGL